jgi:hypothetical protein
MTEVYETLVPPEGFASMRDYRMHVLRRLGVDTEGLAGKVDDHVWAVYDFHLAQAMLNPIGEAS